MNNFVRLIPVLNDMLKRNENDVKLAARELCYDKNRIRVISITQSRKLMELTKEAQNDKLTGGAATRIARDANSILSRFPLHEDKSLKYLIE